MAQSQPANPIIIEVAPGHAKNVKVVEKAANTAEITVRVSREHKSAHPITVGVIQK